MNKRFPLHVLVPVAMMLLAPALLTPLPAMSQSSVPGPQVTGYDWGERWIVRGACSPASNPRGTKNPVTEYRSTIFAFNTADAPITIASFRLEGRDFDSGHFMLGSNQGQDSVRIGDLIRPLDPDSLSRAFQVVVFRPGPEARPYECEAVLTTTTGATVRGTLRGAGVESFIQPAPVEDFGLHSFVPGTTENIQEVFIGTDGTRDVNIWDLQIVPDDKSSAGQFTVINRDSILHAANNPHARNDGLTVRVRYQPTAPGSHGARLFITGDFSPCDDSTTLLTGRAWTLSARPYGYTFGTVLTCFTDSAPIFVENDGSDPISIVGIHQQGAADFSVATPTFPVLIEPGERYPFDLRFTPTWSGVHLGSVTFDVRDASGTEPVLFGGAPVTASFSGSARRTSLTAHIARDYHGPPGTSHAVDVILDEVDPEARIDALDFSLRYDHAVAQHRIDIQGLEELLRGTLLEGWSITMPAAPTKDVISDTMMVMYFNLRAPSGEYLSGTGALLRIPFVTFGTFVGLGMESELPFFLTPSSRLACAEIETAPGLITVDSVPGLFANGGIAMRVEDVGHEIRVDLGVQDYTYVVITVHDLLGRVVGTIHSGGMQTGENRLSFDTQRLPVGEYFVRLVSAGWTEARKVMVVP